MRIATWNVNSIKQRMDCLTAWLSERHPDIVSLQATKSLEESMVLAGDFNVIPTELDARHPERWTRDALFVPRTRAKFRALCNLGLTDAVRTSSDARGPYTFWDYQAGAWQKDDGIRIDHLLLSPQAADRLVAVGVDKHVRGWEKPSDHVPVWAEIALAERG